MKKILILLTALTLLSCNKETHDVKIEGKERVVKVSNGNSNSYYLVFTDKGVFSNGDNFFIWKFNSSDIQNDLRSDKCYNITTYFWRISFFSIYKNIKNFNESECKETN